MATPSSDPVTDAVPVLPSTLLWVSGSLPESLPPRWQKRYRAIAPRVWVDQFPQRPCGEGVPVSLLPYLALFDLPRSLPSLYGCDDGEESRLVLLTRVPLDASHQLLPELEVSLAGADSLQQLSWLCQHLGLWTRLAEQGVAVSLLKPTNLRVQGADLRLLELYGRRDAPLGISRPGQEQATLAEWVWLWRQWLPRLHPDLQAWLPERLDHLNDCRDPGRVLEELEAEHRRRASLLPLHLQIASQTDTGPQRELNEDACHPQPGDRSLHWAAVCDGLGGHAGGEEASRLALEVIRPGIEALIAAMDASPEEGHSPAAIAEQLRRIVIDANDVIFRHNDQRSGVSRMGTTLVLGLHLPQAIPGGGVSHDLYLVNVGDSRGYWLTAERCLQLTLDDDVATQLTRQQQATYHQASLDGSNGALTQALGIFPSASLQVSVQRLVVETEGVLLLCSDGISDCDLIERFALPETGRLLRGEQTLDRWTEGWIDRANQLNGHDNVTLAVLRCSLREPPPDPTPSVPARSASGSPADADTLRPSRHPGLIGLGVGVGLGLLLVTVWAVLRSSPPAPPPPPPVRLQPSRALPLAPPSKPVGK